MAVRSLPMDISSDITKGNRVYFFLSSAAEFRRVGPLRANARQNQRDEQKGSGITDAFLTRLCVRYWSAKRRLRNVIKEQCLNWALMLPPYLPKFACYDFTCISV